MHIEIIGQLAEVRSLFLPCETYRSNSSFQAWHQSHRMEADSVPGGPNGLAQCRAKSPVKAKSEAGLLKISTLCQFWSPFLVWGLCIDQ